MTDDAEIDREVVEEEDIVRGEGVAMVGGSLCQALKRRELEILQYLLIRVFGRV